MKEVGHKTQLSDWPWSSIITGLSQPVLEAFLHYKPDDEP